MSAGLSEPAAHAEVQTISTAGRNVYRLVTANVVQGDRLIVGSTYDNRVCAFTTAGQHRWDADVGGFVFDLATGDLDGDGHEEIVAAAADGWVYALAAEGRLHWKQDLGAPVYQVAVAKLDGRSPVVLASGVSRELVAPYYFEHHIQPILELCLKHGKRFIPRNKDVWWAHWPADPKMREIIFNGRYRSVLLPSVEDSNSRSAEVNLAARVGLWLDGQVDDWASRCSADWFCASRAWEWEYGMTGHPQLRYYVSQAMLGARVYMMLNGEREPRTGRWTRVGSEGTATFLHLLGKGVLTPPRREQLHAISPVALAMQPPSARFIQHGSNGHHEERRAEDGTDAKPWAFDRLDMVDPGWLDPAERTVVIRPQVASAWSATDRLTGQALGTLENSLTLTVPAGSIRLVMLQLAPP